MLGRVYLTRQHFTLILWSAAWTGISQLPASIDSILMQNETVSGRIDLIDIIRGFALFGIALIHFDEQFYLGPLPEVPAGMGSRSIADLIVQAILTTFIQGKFYMIFSFLFGLSFFIQLGKSDGSYQFVLRFGWRLIVLFMIGILHQLHFAGDILTKYAVLGFVLLLVYPVPDRFLLVAGLLLVANMPCFVLRLYNGITAQSLSFFGEELPPHDYFDIMKTGDYLSIVKANWAHMLPKLEFQLSSGRIFITTGLFLLGLLAGRRKYFENWQTHVHTMKRLIKISLWTIGGCILVVLIGVACHFILEIKVRQQIIMAIGGLAIDVSNACMVTVYISCFCLLYRSEKWQRRLQIFCAPGRMGLTTYVAQAFFGIFIYSGIGLGLLGENGIAVNALIGAMVFVLQTYFSAWWLSRFRYGPFEWLWRSATYLRRQVLRKPTTGSQW
jgi:uncharacterized protein